VQVQEVDKPEEVWLLVKLDGWPRRPQKNLFAMIYWLILCKIQASTRTLRVPTDHNCDQTDIWCSPRKPGNQLQSSGRECELQDLPPHFPFESLTANKLYPKELGHAGSELGLAIYKVGQFFSHEWGVAKNQKMGLSYIIRWRGVDIWGEVSVTPHS